MALPKISQPIFTLNLPSTGQKIRYRQFTVKEEKILLVAQASGDRDDMINAFKQLINNCALDPIDVDQMSAADIEYFFIQLRARSVSNVVKVSFNDSADKRQEVEINLDEVKIHQPTVDKKIVLDEEQGVGVIMRQPNFEMITKMLDLDTDSADATIEMFGQMIETIFDEDSVYPTKDTPKAELNEFILSMNQKQVEKIQAYIDDLPYAYIDVEFEDAGEKKAQRIRGLESFFA